MSKKKTTLIPIILTLGLLTIAVVGGLSIYSAYNQATSTTSTDGMTTTISAVTGLSIKRVTSGADSNGNSYQIFTYDTTPSYTKNVCNVSLSFADSRNDADSYLTVNHDTSNKQITVTCLQAFDSQATITLTCGTASANITVDYVQKYLGVASTGTGTVYRTLSYDSTLYDPTNGITTDTHDSICDLLSVSMSTPLYHVQTSSVYTVALTGYSNYYFNGLSVPHGLGYSTYEDYINTSGYDSDLIDCYNDFWCPAFQNLDIAYDIYGISANFTGIYKALNTVWNTLTTAQKQAVVDNCAYVSGSTVYLQVILPRISYMTANIYFPDVNRNDTYTFNKTLDLSIEVMPDWSIGSTANSITLETSSISF